MKIGTNKLKMSDGSVRSFGNEAKRNNFERVAQAYKHGWRPSKNTNKIKRTVKEI